MNECKCGFRKEGIKDFQSILYGSADVNYQKTPLVTNDR